MKFEIGEIPRGWTRGDALRVHHPSPNMRGAVINVEPPARPYGERNISSEDIAAVTFLEKDVEQVTAWLSWWRSTPRVLFDSLVINKTDYLGWIVGEAFNQVTHQFSAKPGEVFDIRVYVGPAHSRVVVRTP